MADEELLARAERALTEIKVNQGLSEDHAAVLAALRLRLTGKEDGTLDEMLAAAEADPGSPTLGEKIAQAEAKAKLSLDDLLSKEPRPKPDWPT